MALNAAIEWEVRTTATSGGVNGGGFKAGASGVDYSQQDAAQKTGSDLAIHASDNTKIQPVAAGVSANDIGNVVNITAGSGFTTGRYEITAQDGTYWTVDRAAGTVGSTGGTYYMGGAVSSPGAIGGVVVSGNTIHIKSGTYNLTTSSSNVDNGPIAPTQQTTWEGYGSTRWDTGTKPVISVNSTAGVTLVLGKAFNYYNIEVDCTNVANCSGISAINAQYCKATNGNRSSGNPYGIRASHSLTHSSVISGGSGNTTEFYDAFVPESTTCRMYMCYAEGCYFGFRMGSVATSVAIRCIAYNCRLRGFSVDSAWLVDCVAHTTKDASGDGFYDASATFVGYKGCVAVNCTGYAFYNTGSPTLKGILQSCAQYNCTSGMKSGKLTEVNTLSLSGDPFNNAASGDFRLNNTSGQGLALQDVLTFPMPTPDTLDAGAADHVPTGGGGGGYVIGS